MEGGIGVYVFRRSGLTVQASPGTVSRRRAGDFP